MQRLDEVLNSCGFVSEDSNNHVAHVDLSLYRFWFNLSSMVGTQMVQNGVNIYAYGNRVPLLRGRNFQ